ncbi:MAG: PPC domain-containing DNA-binding protein [Candidatus Methanofastidiosia archaeon]
MKHRAFEKGYVLKLESGEDILDVISEFLKKNGVKSTVIFGIGAVSEARIGFFDGTEYRVTELNENLEVLSLLGNVSLKEEEPLPHLHITLADSEGRAFGGHLFKGCIVSATLEVFILELPILLERDFDEGIGLWLLKVGLDEG